ncbi:alpha/beta fold hydrolase [Arthrobacter cryoconiti]|uniref:Alpha/beta fold hydrolase n=1 Tax=Arthrobacter cryoconiti TaxID=748907 RepID=A0ABV8R3I2_9MICC|nr:alpha/beta hydrolase [Arthrobacter cryoconiti]MCC9069863.1 alpha/beta hydrolase [Arthrobacter cryoconiti]
MKQFLKITLKAIAALTAVVVASLATTSIVNASASKSEAARLKSYGQLVSVNGRKMNVSLQGTGPETVVLIPGAGTASPVLDFKPLITELLPHYRVVVIEPFGYGLSEETTTERTTENIVNELHQALQTLGIDRYILMGHSIAGIYGLDFANRFRSEVIAFVGIDNSVPNQPGMDKKFPLGALRAAKPLGLARVLVNSVGDVYAGLPYSDDDKTQIKILSQKNMLTSTYINEIKNLEKNFVDARSQFFPHDLPVLEFIQAENKAAEAWLPLHEEQVAGVDYGKLVPLDGQHSLHRTLSKEIVAVLADFMTEAPKTKTRTNEVSAQFLGG